MDDVHLFAADMGQMPNRARTIHTIVSSFTRRTMEMRRTPSRGCHGKKCNRGPSRRRLQTTWPWYCCVVVAGFKAWTTQETLQLPTSKKKGARFGSCDTSEGNEQRIIQQTRVLQGASDSLHTQLCIAAGFFSLNTTKHNSEVDNVQWVAACIWQSGFPMISL